MAALAPASALLLALLPAFAVGAGALEAAEEAPLEQLSEECEECTASAMRVELLQRSLGASAAARTAAVSRAGDQGTPETYRSQRQHLSNTVTKSTFAISSSHTGKALAFKRWFLPVVTEEEASGMERPDFSQSVKEAIAKGAARPDESESSAERFAEVSTKMVCGSAARVRFRERPSMEELPLFHMHGVRAEAWGNGTGGCREVGGLKVRDVERIFQEELDDLDEYSPWMDIHFGFYDNDLDSYARRFLKHDVPILALRWPSADKKLFQHVYSLIVHVPDTQEVFEIISVTAPSDTRLVVRDFPMTRHVFRQEELQLLRKTSEPVQLHISRSHYDLDVVKAHYEKFFDMRPIEEVRDADSGVGFVSFWHQSALASKSEYVDPIRVQVMYWNRPDQSMTVAHTTAWFERRLEQLNAQYMQSYKSCWPIWGDNHYTISGVPVNYFASVQKRYDDAGIGYMLFQVQGNIFTGYFPLPGGMYLEMQVENDARLPAAKGVRNWIPKEGVESHSQLDSSGYTHGLLYCWEFQCPS